MWPTFNSMLDHRLHRARSNWIRRLSHSKAIRSRGRVYAYWGIFPALLRFPSLARRAASISTSLSGPAWQPSAWREWRRSYAVLLIREARPAEPDRGLGRLLVLLLAYSVWGGSGISLPKNLHLSGSDFVGCGIWRGFCLFRYSRSRQPLFRHQNALLDGPLRRPVIAYARFFGRRPRARIPIAGSLARDRARTKRRPEPRGASPSVCACPHSTPPSTPRGNTRRPSCGILVQ